MIAAPSRLLLYVALLAPAPVSGMERGDIGNVPKNRLICKMHTEIGSLARKRKQCFTRAQWDRIAEATHESSRPNAETLDTRPGAETANDLVIGIMRGSKEPRRSQR